MSGQAFPYRLERAGLLMSPDVGDPLEAEGVLNPAAGWSGGELYLLPRLVAAGNVSRIGLARITLDGGRPVGVTRLGVVLEPTMTWEHGPLNAGVEDPRVTWIPALQRHVMTYVAYGPTGPRTAIATSTDLREWQRLGPVTYRWDAGSEVDLNLYHNKDAVFLPEPVTAPDGQLSFAVMHRPMGVLNPDTSISDLPGDIPPSGQAGHQSMWMSFVPVAAATDDLSALAHWRGHRFVAGPEYDWEELKIGGGPPPVRVPEGWLLLHHGVTGRIDPGTDQQQHVHYAAGGMILDAERPWLVISRSDEPLLQAETADERSGTVPNVVFPTAIVEIDGHQFVFYGMADSTIGVARLVRS